MGRREAQHRVLGRNADCKQAAWPEQGNTVIHKTGNVCYMLKHLEMADDVVLAAIPFYLLANTATVNVKTSSARALRRQIVVLKAKIVDRAMNLQTEGPTAAANLENPRAPRELTYQTCNEVEFSLVILVVQVKLLQLLIKLVITGCQRVVPPQIAIRTAKKRHLSAIGRELIGHVDTTEMHPVRGDDVGSGNTVDSATRPIATGRADMISVKYLVHNQTSLQSDRPTMFALRSSKRRMPAIS